ncbi:MAG: glycosyltransferase family 4 protein [Betaproteobacteria bacterium]|nr:glycosyltransferase family 4 protein [Betaproteobacteria bacterium]
MRLAIIRRRYNPYGGAERFIERLIPRLAQRNIDTTILTEQWEKNSAEAKVITVPVSGMSRAARFRSFNSQVTAQLAQQSAQGSGFDLIQSHERILGADIYRLGDGVHAAWVSRMQKESSGLRAFWLGMDSFHRAVMQTESAMARDPNLHFVANSSLVQQELQDLLAVPEDRITLIPNGVDTQRFAPAMPSQKASARDELAQATGLVIAPESLVVAVVGSGFSRKGIFLLIEACARLKECVLLICGKDKESAKAQSLIARLGAADRIALTGPLEDVRPLLWAADVFSLPSLYDPSSNAVLEALSCGVPVIVTQDVGMAWEVTDADAGLICERSVASLMQALRKCEDEDRLRKIAYQARAFALRYDQGLIIEQWLNFYQAARSRKRS